MKVIVNHTGVCSGHHYKAGEIVDLPDEVIAALGENAKPLEEEKPKAASKPFVKKEVKKAPLDKMVGKENVVSKNV